MAFRKAAGTGGVSLSVSFTTFHEYFIFCMSSQLSNSPSFFDIAISLCSALGKTYSHEHHIVFNLYVSNNTIGFALIKSTEISFSFKTISKDDPYCVFNIILFSISFGLTTRDNPNNITLTKLFFCNRL